MDTCSWGFYSSKQTCCAYLFSECFQNRTKNVAWFWGKYTPFVMVEMFILLVGKSSSVFVLFISDSVFPNYPVICRVLYKIGIVYNFPSSSRTFATCGDPTADSKKTIENKVVSTVLKCHYGEFFLKLS